MSKVIPIKGSGTIWKGSKAQKFLEGEDIFGQRSGNHQYFSFRFQNPSVEQLNQDPSFLIIEKRRFELIKPKTPLSTKKTSPSFLRFSAFDATTTVDLIGRFTVGKPFHREVLC